MAQAAFNLNRFISEVRNEGLARNNRFEVILNAPPALRSSDRNSKASLLCEVANFPPLNLIVKPFKIFGPTYQRPISSEYGGDGMSMTFHLDRKMTVKRLFDDWVQYIVNNNDFTVAYPETYRSEVLVRQLDEQNNITYEIKLIEAFPRSINLLDLNQSSQNQTHRLNVIFAYRYWLRTDKEDNRTIVPTVNFNIKPLEPELIGIQSTNTSDALQSLGGASPNIDFSDSTFSTPSA